MRPPLPGPTHSPHDPATLLVATLSVAALAAAAAVPPSVAQDGPTLCPFRALTGLPCPGCGLTRSWVALAHGDVTASLGFHPLGWALLLVAAALVVRTARHLLARRPVPAISVLVPRPVVVAVVLATAAVGWVRIWSVTAGA